MYIYIQHLQRVLWSTGTQDWFDYPVVTFQKKSMDGFYVSPKSMCHKLEFPDLLFIAAHHGSPWNFRCRCGRFTKNQIFCLESRLADAGVFLTRPRFFGEGSRCVGIWWLVVDEHVSECGTWQISLGHGEFPQEQQRLYVVSIWVATPPCSKNILFLQWGSDQWRRVQCFSLSSPILPWQQPRHVQPLEQLTTSAQIPQPPCAWKVRFHGLDQPTQKRMKLFCPKFVNLSIDPNCLVEMVRF